ncbi:MAG TPA: hypothetical protein VMP01_26960 [Pirellulaceae bacterium]|nr:hypothetical protein [Pirellulaceae bacterium]
MATATVRVVLAAPGIGATEIFRVLVAFGCRRAAVHLATTVSAKDKLQDELRVTEAAGKPMDVTGEVDAVVGRLWRLGEEMAGAEPARRREVFRLFVDQIELRFDHVKQGKKPRALSDPASFTSGRERARSSVL